jgi:hypothetical protein
MLDFTVFLSSSTEKILRKEECKPLASKINSEDFLEELTDFQLPLEQVLTDNSTITRNKFFGLIKNRPKSQQKIFLKVFELIRKNKRKLRKC